MAAGGYVPVKEFGEKKKFKFPHFAELSAPKEGRQRGQMISPTLMEAVFHHDDTFTCSQTSNTEQADSQVISGLNVSWSLNQSLK